MNKFGVREICPEIIVSKKISFNENKLIDKNSKRIVYISKIKFQSTKSVEEFIVIIVNYVCFNNKKY